MDNFIVQMKSATTTTMTTAIEIITFVYNIAVLWREAHCIDWLKPGPFENRLERVKLSE